MIIIQLDWLSDWVSEWVSLFRLLLRVLTTTGKKTSGSDLEKGPRVPVCVDFLQTLSRLPVTSGKRRQPRNRNLETFWTTRLLPLQPDVGTGRPGRQVLQPAGPHHRVLLPVDHLRGRGGGHNHGVHHPPGGRRPEGGLGGQRQVHHQLGRRPPGPHPVSWKTFFSLMPPQSSPTSISGFHEKVKVTHTHTHTYFTTLQQRLHKARVNYGTGAICRPLSFLIRAADIWRNYISSTKY